MLSIVYRIPCKVQGTPMPTVSWYRNGITLEPTPRYKVTTDQQAGESTIEITQIREDDTGTYQVVAENSTGRIMSTCIVTIKSKYMFQHCLWVAFNCIELQFESFLCWMAQ